MWKMPREGKALQNAVENLYAKYTQNAGRGGVDCTGVTKTPLMPTRIV